MYIDGAETGTASVVSMEASYSFRWLTLDTGDKLDVLNTAQFTVGGFTGSGSLVNNSTIDFQNVGGFVYLRFAEPGSISGL